LATESEREIRMKKIKSALVVGVVGGIFWPLIAYAFYFMNFTTIGPSVFAKPFFTSTMVNKPVAHLTGIVVIALISIGVSLLYVFILSKYYTPWLGLGLGLVLFIAFFYGINPLFDLTDKSIHKLGMNTFTTSLCLFLLYGLFTGFSLSAEFSSKEENAK